MIADRRLARIVGVLYLLTFATSIPALVLKRAFLRGEAPDAMPWAALLEIVLGLACVGTSVAFYPVGRRHNPALAVGFVASRTLEAAAVLIGVIALLAVAALRGAAPGGQAGDPTAIETALVALHDGAFLLGPGLLPAANALLFGTLLYRARLVPRIIPLVGLIGAPLLVLSAFGTLFGVIDQVSPVAGAAALPIALWEFGIGLWLLLKGFTGGGSGGPGDRDQGRG